MNHTHTHTLTGACRDNHRTTGNLPRSVDSEPLDTAVFRSPAVIALDWPRMDALVRAYARLTPLVHLRLPSASPGVFQRIHDELLNEILLGPHLRAYPPAPEYQLKFWKWALAELEALIGDEVSVYHPYGFALRNCIVGQDTEIDARMYDRLVELVQSTPSSQSLTGTSVPPSPSYVTHYLRLRSGAPNAIHRITLLESRTTIEQGTTGLKTWPAAHALAEWLGNHPGRP